MVAPTPTSPMAAVQTLARDYDQQQRLRLTRHMALALVVATLVVVAATYVSFAASGAFGQHMGPALGTVGVATLAMMGIAGGYWLAGANQARWAAITVTLVALIEGCLLTLFSTSVLGWTGVGPIVGFFALLFGIVVAGLLSARWMLIAATLLVNAFTIVSAFVIMPHLLSPPVVVPLPLVAVALVSQWMCAALLRLNQMRYQQMLRSFAETQTAYAQAQQLDDLKDQFISSVNHELRNPVMAMMNYVTILRQRHEAMAPDKRAEYLASLDETGRRVIQLIGSILDIRQLAQHPEEFEPAAVNIKETVVTASQLLDPAEARMTKRDLLVNVPRDLTIWGNGVYLQQILTNLLSNATKYSEPGTPIEVNAVAVVPAAEALGHRQRERAMVEITVRDHGLGVPAEQAPLLFNRFVRLQRDLTSSVSGNGLGLYLCKVLTEAMGGKIWLESSGVAGEGTAFHLVLPAEPEIAQPAPIAAPTILSVPVRQARMAIAAVMAVFVALAGVLIVTQRPAAPGISITDSVHFFDAGGGALTGVDMDVSGLNAPPAGTQYDAWMINAPNDQYVALGEFMPQDGRYSLHYMGGTTSQNLLGAGDEIAITVERPGSSAPVGRSVLVGFFPQKAMVHLRHLLVSFPATPQNKGLLVGLLQQAQLLAQQAQQLQMTGSRNPTLARCLILSQLNILEGDQGSAKQPLPATCQHARITGGDGYGIINLTDAQGAGYIAGAIDHAALTIQQSDATSEMHEHGPRVADSLMQVQTQATTLDGQLRQLLNHFDAKQLASVTATAQRILAGNADGGTPPPDSGPPPGSGPPPNADSVIAAYYEGQLMADFTFANR